MTAPNTSIAVGQDEADKGSPSAPIVPLAGHTISGKFFPAGILCDEAGEIVSPGALLTALGTYVDALEGQTDGIEGLLTSLGGYVDGLEALLTSLNGYVDGLESLISTVSDPYLGKTPITKCADFTSAQTAIDLWVPTSGTRFNIVDYEIAFSAAGTLTLFDSTDTTANRVAKWFSVANGGAVKAYRFPRKSANVNQNLKYTTSSGAAGSIIVNGYES